MNNLLESLRSRVLVCDGAMGTQLMRRGMMPGECGMLWNVSRPDDVAHVHREYYKAGCQMITTNSFGGSRVALDQHGMADRVAELNLASARLARQVAGQDVWVLGDVGPFGGFLEPVGDVSETRLDEIFREQIAALIEGGADAILVETMSDPNEAAVAVRAAKKLSSIPVIATFAFQKAGPKFCTMMGSTVEDVVNASVKAGADIVGANCGTSLDLEDYVTLAETLVAAAGPVPVIVQPNAGSPRIMGADAVYDALPEGMAQLALRLRKTGVRVIGGCCGTTPAHLEAMARALRS
jgi:5-methyltetrahydrofolate--homocysteine methyltransferase